jgi:hypothetical protein
MYSTVLLEKRCVGCTLRTLYIARMYEEPINAALPFNQLPKYLGTCLLTIENPKTHVHVSAMSMPNGEFTDPHHLDIWLRILEAEPTLETASWERHKPGGLVQRSIRIVDTIRVLTKRVSGS